MDITYHGKNGTEIVDSTRNIMSTLFLIALRNIMLLYSFGVSLKVIYKKLDKQQPTPWRLLIHHFIFIVIMMIMIIISFQ